MRVGILRYRAAITTGAETAPPHPTTIWGRKIPMNSEACKKPFEALTEALKKSREILRLNPWTSKYLAA